MVTERLNYSRWARWQRIPRAVRWTGAVLVTLVVMLSLTLSITDWNFARANVASLLSAKLNRQVRIDGALTAKLLSSRPRVRVEGLKVGNPEWTEGDFADIERLVISINLRALLTGNLVLETLEVDNPKVAIISDLEGRNNFDFATKGNKSSRPPKLPIVRHFTMRGGQLYVSNAIHKLTFNGAIEASESPVRLEDEPFRLRGTGKLNGEPFALLFKGGPLANIKMDQPYAFDADVTAGKTQGTASGAFARPFDFGTLVTALDVKGENLAHLYYLTGLALPFTPPYRIAGELRSSDQHIVLHKLDGKVGSSDIKGEITVDLTNERPKLTAKLKSRSLNLGDLSPALGKGVAVDRKTGEVLDSVAPGDLPADKLLPTYEFQFDRLRKMDAEMSLHADSVQTQKVPIKSVDINLKLKDGVLVLDPIVFTLPQGKMAGTAHIDAREKIAKSKLDLRLTNVKLDQFKGKKMLEPPLDGMLHARMQLTGTGNSVHDIAANANGQLNAVVPHGEIRKAFAELTGINVARGLGLLLAKDQDRSTVRCGVAVLQVKDGNAQVEQMVFDTETVLIKGDGKIDLKSEALNLDIDGEPKKVRLLRLRTPITVNGTLRKPAVGIDKSDTAKQVGIAGALGALFTPLAAALAFIDPGLAKDADCAALLAEAEKALPKTKVSAVVATP
ncbi:MAG: AsmA family protein [Candidatus Obscuribacterales bacterium]|nr:AsmA family protein [Steroidobacteraceae bacterium]